jgi:hypothetical protein
MQSSVEAELIGVTPPACFRLCPPPGALNGQYLLPQLAAQPETDLADQPLPALHDLQCACISLAQGLVVDSVAYGYPGRAHVLEAVAAGVLVLQVVQQFPEKPGVRAIADTLVPDRRRMSVGKRR